MGRLALPERTADRLRSRQKVIRPRSRPTAVYAMGNVSKTGARPPPSLGDGANRDRTGDLLLAKQALSQLSYGPDIGWWVWEELHPRPHPYQGCALTN